MHKNQIVWLLFAPLLIPSQCLAQGMAEFGGTHAAAAGLGAGMAASANHGKFVRNSYEAMIKTQQIAAMETKLIEQYMKVGCDLEAKKKWAQAQESFEYVLKVIARRDGPGSVKSVSTLEHLVSVTKAQDKLDEAIRFQKTVLAFKQAAPEPDTHSIVKAQTNLSDLFVQKGDYAAAEPVLHESVVLCDSHSSLPRTERRKTLKSYTKVLRKLHKDSEAEAIEVAHAKDLEENDEKSSDTSTTENSSQLAQPVAKTTGESITEKH